MQPLNPFCSEEDNDEYDLKELDYLTDDDKEYLREYPETCPESKWYDYDFMKDSVAMLYDVDIQAMKDTGYPETSVMTSNSYTILEKLGFDFQPLHKAYNILQPKS